MSVVKLRYYFPTYRFYDTPDGEDFFKKLTYSTKWGSFLGLGTAFVDVGLISQCRTPLEIASRSIYVAGPILGMFTAFSTSTYFVANMRGKNDWWNHLFGGAAAGAVYGGWQKSIGKGVYAALALGAFAAMRKDAESKGWLLFPTDGLVQEGAGLQHKWNWSLVDERPRRWTTDPNDTAMDPKLSIEKAFIVGDIN